MKYARQARWTPKCTVVTPDTNAATPVNLNTAFHTPQECMGTGVPYETFINERLDFRKWGTLTYSQFVECGDMAGLVRLLEQFEHTREEDAKHQLVVAVDELPLNRKSIALLERVVISVGYMIERMQPKQLRARCAEIGEIVKYSATWVSQWTLQFIHNRGMFCSVGYTPRERTSILSDPVNKKKMIVWMTNALKHGIDTTAEGFAKFCSAEFGTTISTRSAQRWLNECGFKYKSVTKQQIYLDGHQRADVQDALKEYIKEMDSILPRTVVYTGEYMETEIIGRDIGMQRRVIVSYHDECCAHTADRENRSWFHMNTGSMQPKSKGSARMVSAYCCADVGVWQSSIKYIEPGTGDNKDDWWKGSDLVQQAREHLLEVVQAFPDCDIVDVYDNSTGHNCRAPDALDIENINAKPGGRNYKAMRNGYYTVDGAKKEQSMYFGVGDTLHIKVTKGTEVSTSTAKYKTITEYEKGYIVTSDSELVGVAKGAKQLLEERGLAYQYAKCAKVKHREEMSASRTYTLEEWIEDKYNYDKLCDYLMIPGSSDASDLADTLACNCCMCVLSSQPDFVAQKSWLEEVYSDYNNVYGTAHKCIFLPKFHPELNPIERVWSMMKRHCRQCSNGSMERLSQSMSYALSSVVASRVPYAT